MENNRLDFSDKVILKVRVGSKLYGTDTLESDDDFVGIYMPSEEDLFGLSPTTVVPNEAIKSKDESGKNTKEAVDCTYYEFKKFVSLARQGNPNIIEVLFVNPENILHINYLGRSLLDNRNLFISQNCIHRILAYANAQKHKMIIKTENLKDLEIGLTILNGLPDKLTMAEVVSDQQKYVNKSFFKNYSEAHVKCGDLCFERGTYVKKAWKIIKDRLEKASWRKEGILEKGYDPKFASHLIRLLLEAGELLSYKQLQFPLVDKSKIRDIKEGKYELKNILDLAEQIEQHINSLDWSALPKETSFKKINNFTIQTIKKSLYNSKTYTP